MALPTRSSVGTNAVSPESFVKQCAAYTPECRMKTAARAFTILAKIVPDDAATIVTDRNPSVAHQNKLALSDSSVSSSSVWGTSASVMLPVAFGSKADILLEFKRFASAHSARRLPCCTPRFRQLEKAEEFAAGVALKCQTSQVWRQMTSFAKHLQTYLALEVSNSS